MRKTWWITIAAVIVLAAGGTWAFEAFEGGAGGGQSSKATAPLATVSGPNPSGGATKTAHADILPTLGKIWSEDQQGYGQVKPTTVSNGGDPTGVVTDVTWSSWGGNTATGTGASTYLSANASSMADAIQAKATIVAFDLGTCDGKLMYQAIEWYFPEYGESFDPSTYINICTGTYEPPPPD
jgi:hypothetical protein